MLLQNEIILFAFTVASRLKFLCEVFLWLKFLTDCDACKPWRADGEHACITLALIDWFLGEVTSCTGTQCTWLTRLCNYGLVDEVTGWEGGKGFFLGVDLICCDIFGEFFWVKPAVSSLLLFYLMKFDWLGLDAWFNVEDGTLVGNLDFTVF